LKKSTAFREKWLSMAKMSKKWDFWKSAGQQLFPENRPHTGL